MTNRKIDLTLLLHEGMVTFPVAWHPVVEITQLGRHGVEGRETRKFLLGTHTGTHCDAPRHFIPGGATVEELSLDTLIGPALVVDFTHIGPFGEAQVADFEAQVGEARPERIVMRFDWSDRWGNLAYYSDHPYISDEAAQWLVDRGVLLLAMDTPMPDNPKNGRGTDNDSPVHKILLGNGMILVEYLCNLRELRRREVELIVLPLKLEKGDGCPVRAVAIERG
ncbi:MAG: putative cyclase family protein [Armatimonadetes bacterium]|jgi:kynurenine formamidase|nr:putative cyclase family protein [Armatimonadota bacterium]